MSWPAVLAVLALAVSSSGSSSEAPAKREKKEPVLRLPPPPRWKRLQSERRIVTEQVGHDDYGVVRSATRYSPSEWEPLPWTLTVWRDADEDAEVFTLVPHRDVSEHDLKVSVLWSSYMKPGDENFRHRADQIGRDERFHNRLIDRDGKGSGTYLIEVRFSGDKVSFFHRPKQKQLPEKRLRSPVLVLPPAPPPNPFEERVAAFIRLQEQYEEAKERVSLRKLPQKIELAAYDELDRVYQDEVNKLEEAEQHGG